MNYIFSIYFCQSYFLWSAVKWWFVWLYWYSIILALQHHGSEVTLTSCQSFSGHQCCCNISGIFSLSPFTSTIQYLNFPPPLLPNLHISVPVLISATDNGGCLVIKLSEGFAVRLGAGFFHQNASRSLLVLAQLANKSLLSTATLYLAYIVGYWRKRHLLVALEASGGNWWQLQRQAASSAGSFRGKWRHLVVALEAGDVICW